MTIPTGLAQPRRAPLDPERYRADFPILSTAAPSGKTLVYLDNAATTQRPRSVIQAIVDTYLRTAALPDFPARGLMSTTIQIESFVPPFLMPFFCLA